MKNNENEIKNVKKCSKCGEEKPIDRFTKNKSSCKLCRKHYNKINRERDKEYNKLYNEKNKDKRKEWDKKHYLNNKENHYKNHQKWREKNKEKHNKYLKDYYEKNLGNKKEYNKQYSKKNRDKKRKYESKRLKSDIQFKLRKILRIRLISALKNNSKYSSALKLLDCSIKEFKLYLEKQFLPEFTWENHGIIWEIDHIKPCSSFDLTNIEQQKQCFHYTNLQPLFKTTEIAESFGYSDQIGNRNKNKY